VAVSRSFTSDCSCPTQDYLRSVLEITIMSQYAAPNLASCFTLAIILEGLGIVNNEDGDNVDEGADGVRKGGNEQ